MIAILYYILYNITKIFVKMAMSVLLLKGRTGCTAKVGLLYFRLLLYFSMRRESCGDSKAVDTYSIKLLGCSYGS